MSVVREVCRIIDVKYELMITLVFVIVSGSYILYRHGFEDLADTLMQWMFPASLMIFITLVVMLLPEKVYIQR